MAAISGSETDLVSSWRAPPILDLDRQSMSDGKRLMELILYE